MNISQITSYKLENYLFGLDDIFKTYDQKANGEAFSQRLWDSEKLVGSQSNLSSRYLRCFTSFFPLLVCNIFHY